MKSIWNVLLGLIFCLTFNVVGAVFPVCVLPSFFFYFHYSVHREENQKHLFQILHYKQKSFVFMSRCVCQRRYNSSNGSIKVAPNRSYFQEREKNDLMASCQCKVINQLLYPFISFHILCITGSWHANRWWNFFNCSASKF